MAISDTTIKAAKPLPDKPYKLSDEKGLHILINPSGSKYFRLKYRFDGKEKTLALGVYPETTLKVAREKRDTARKQIANGIDPSENKKAVKESRLASADNGFEIIAREWGAKHVNNWDDKTNRAIALELDPKNQNFLFITALTLKEFSEKNNTSFEFQSFVEALNFLDSTHKCNSF